MPKDIVEATCAARSRHAYRPEFLNRIDSILVFHAAARRPTCAASRSASWASCTGARGCSSASCCSRWTTACIDLLLDRGFDPKYGARPLKRAIEEILVMPLARAVLARAGRALTSCFASRARATA